MNKNGNTDTDKHSEVSIDVCGLVDDTGGSSEKHFLENGHHEEKTDEKNDQSKNENSDPGNLIVPEGCVGLEEGGATIGGLVARDDTNLRTGGVGWVFGILAFNGVVVFTGFSFGDTLDDVLVGNDDHLGEWSNKLLDRSDPLFTITCTEVSDTKRGQTVEVSGDKFDGEEDSNGQKIEHIVDCGSSKCAFELVAISHLSHGDNGIGDCVEQGRNNNVRYI